MRVVELENLTIDVVEEEKGEPTIYVDFPQGISVRLYRLFRDKIFEELMVTLGTMGYKRVWSKIESYRTSAIKFQASLFFELDREEAGIVYAYQDIV